VVQADVEIVFRSQEEGLERLRVVWDEAEERQSVFSLVSEAMERVRRDEDCVAGADLRFLVAAAHEAVAAKYENLVLPSVRMTRRVPSRRHFEVSHGKMLGAVTLGY
jgi:hypothetical protein